MNSTAQIIILVGAIASAIVAIGYFFNRVFKLFATFVKFTNDWYGTEDNLGVNERLEHGAKRFEFIEGELKIIKDELFNNSGSSLRDAIDRIEAATVKTKKKNSSPPSN
jgi:hypothetical protein